MVVAWIIFAVAGLGFAAYWLLVLTEGTYLGPKVVTLLYDWTAARYDRIKDLQYIHELRFLGLPLQAALSYTNSPRVLDVATGTGRLPAALLAQGDFKGLVVGVDRSLRMMTQAKATMDRYDSRVVLMQQDAAALAFEDAAFDCVTCLEALEFMGDPTGVLLEMMRVLKPGGLLLLSNRVGRDAWLFPARMCGRGKLESYLQRLGLERVSAQPWQEHYDLVWAYKPAVARCLTELPQGLDLQKGKG